MERRRPVVDERMQVHEVRFHDCAVDADTDVLAGVIDQGEGRHGSRLDAENVTHPFGAGEAQPCRADEPERAEVEFA